jgi:hypothetical protein
MSSSFRRRRDPWDSAHERARYRAAERVDGAIEPDEEAWLEAHVADCAECRALADTYEAQHIALRAYRNELPEPPRDLWARTAAAIEREADRSNARRGAARARRAVPLPLGAISGMLVVAVVVGAALLSGRPAPSITPPSSDTALGSSPASFVVPKDTPIPVTAHVDFVTVGSGGSKFHQAQVNEVCTDKDDPDCASIPESSPVAVELPSQPESVIRSPTQNEIVVISTATASKGASLMLLPAPSSSASASPPPVTPTPSPADTSSPATSTSPSPTPSEGPVPVLEDQLFDPTAAYSPDGAWFAFSARRADGSQGPDVYVVRAGETSATPLTTDHRSVFASWLGNVVIASRTLPAEADATASPSPAPIEGETIAIDPATGASAVVTGRGLWRPAIDPSHERAVYWDGALEAAENGAMVQATEGSLVIGPWPSFDPASLSREELPDASDAPAASEDPAADASPTETSEPSVPSSSVTPSESASVTPTRAGSDTVEVLKTGPIADWDARWDETGTHLAVWIADQADRSVGHLSLYVLDPATGRLEADDKAIKGVLALPGFSIGKGRLAYATPPGQDGNGSSVRVQAWTENGIGEGGTEGSHDQVIVVR